MEIKTLELENKIASFCKKRNISKNQFVGDVIKAGLSYYTAIRLWEGELSFSTTTLQIVANIYKVNISDLIDTKK